MMDTVHDRVCDRVLHTLRSGLDAIDVLGEVDFSDDVNLSYEDFLAYNSMHVLKDPKYLDWLLDKLRSYVGWDFKRHTAISAERAEAIREKCTSRDVHGVVDGLAMLTRGDFEVLGI